jgi:hypothetical protein
MKPGRGVGPGFARDFAPIAFDPVAVSISLAPGPSLRND